MAKKKFETINAVLTVARAGVISGGKGDPIDLPIAQCARFYAAGEVSVPNDDERAAVQEFIAEQEAEADVATDPAPVEDAQAVKPGVETAAAGAKSGGK